MAFKAPAQKEMQRSLPPKGITIGRCYSIIDVGTQKSSWNGEEKLTRKVMIGFELPKHTKVFKPERGPEPYVLSDNYTLSMGEKANLRKMIEGWIGKTLTKEEANNFDLASLVGKPCLITIAHEEHEGKVYANIMNISEVMEGMDVPAQINPSVIYQVDQGRDKVFASLHDWQKKKIEASVEFSRQDNVPEDEQADAYAKELEEKNKLPY